MTLLWKHFFRNIEELKANIMTGAIDEGLSFDLIRFCPFFADQSWWNIHNDDQSFSEGCRSWICWERHNPKRSWKGYWWSNLFIRTGEVLKLHLSIWLRPQKCHDSMVCIKVIPNSLYAKMCCRQNFFPLYINQAPKDSFQELSL